MAAARSACSPATMLAPAALAPREQNQRPSVALMADTERFGFDEATSTNTASVMAPASTRLVNRLPCRDDLSSDKTRAASHSWCSSSLLTRASRSSRSARSAGSTMSDLSMA